MKRMKPEFATEGRKIGPDHPRYVVRGFGDLSLHGSAEEMFLRADRIIEEMIIEILETRPEPSPQFGEIVSLCRRTPDDRALTEATTLDQVFDRIRMLDAEDYPPGFLDVGPFRLSFRRAARRSRPVLADVEISLREAS